MEIHGFMVYWTEAHFGARSQLFTISQMSEALNFMSELRKKEGVEFVTFIQQNPDCVGKPGVTAFNGLQADGVTPYDWKKRRL